MPSDQITLLFLDIVASRLDSMKDGRNERLRIGETVRLPLICIVESAAGQRLEVVGARTRQFGMQRHQTLPLTRLAARGQPVEPAAPRVGSGYRLRIEAADQTLPGRAGARRDRGFR